jgi:quercetin dioxygenase-like cupin family protein
VVPSAQPAETLVARSDTTVELLVDHPSVAASAACFAGGGPVPPPHAHAEHTEVFLVLDGALRFRVVDNETVAGAGTVVVVPPGAVHTFTTEGEARFLDLHAPSCRYGAFLRALTAAGDESEQARARAAFDQHPAPAGGGNADPASIAVVRTGGTDGEAITDRPDRRVTLLADTEHLTLTEFEYGPGQRGASPHVHHDHSDAFLVVEGELELTFESGPLRASAGTFALVPPDVVHSFDTSNVSARFFNIHAPSCGFGDYLRGRNPGFDQHEPPPGGGLDPAGVVVRTFRTGTGA